MSEEAQISQLDYVGLLQGHSDWVTCIVAGNPVKENEESSMLISGSRDKSIMIWKLFDEPQDKLAGTPFRQMTGHNHFVSDISLTNDNLHLISSSWDRTLRLWDLNKGVTRKQFTGHTKEVHAVTFSNDARMILSAGAENDIKLWNTRGILQHSTKNNNHTDWVSCLRYSPLSKTKEEQEPYFASVGWDGKIKIWTSKMAIKYSFKAHDGNVNSLSIAPDSNFIATGGKDKKLNIWKLEDLSTAWKEYDAGSQINKCAFNTKLQWIAAATENGLKVWDLNAGKNPFANIVELQPSTGKKAAKPIACTSVAWNAGGNKLFAGFADGTIRVYRANAEQQ